MAQPQPLRQNDIEHVFRYPEDNPTRIEIIVVGDHEITFDNSEPVALPASILPLLHRLTDVQQNEAIRAHALMVNSRKAIDTLTEAQDYLTHNGLVAVVQEAARTLRTVRSPRPPSCKDFNSLRQLEPKARSDLIALLLPHFEINGVVVRSQALDTILNDLSAFNTHWTVYLSTDTGTPGRRISSAIKHHQLDQNATPAEILDWASKDKVLKFSRWIYGSGTLNYPPQAMVQAVPVPAPMPAPAFNQPSSRPTQAVTASPSAVHAPAPVPVQAAPVVRPSTHPLLAENSQTAPGISPATNHQQPAPPHMAPANPPANMWYPDNARAWGRGEGLEGRQNPVGSTMADRARKRVRRDPPE